MTLITVIGGGLAGSEAAWQLARSGIDVSLLEMKPDKSSPAHTSDQLGELVCSNSLRSRNTLNAVGLLKDEMRRIGSLIIDAALATRVPAGDALAVDREAFSRFISRTLQSHPRIEIRTQCVRSLDEVEGQVVLATGPLTDAPLGEHLRALSGQDHMHFYDAIAPIVAGDSIDLEVVFAASRYGKGSPDDYLNCPLNEEQYQAFLDALLGAESMPLHSFEEPRFFQGCQPVEVVAASGPDTLRFGTMKPVGLRDPRTSKRPYAVVQLRREDKDGQAFNLVGFQTKLTHPEQRRVFRLIPGLERAEFLRLGAVHRNTYLDAPAVLDRDMRLRQLPRVRVAGQLTGVEGYVESAAHGLAVALSCRAELRQSAFCAPPETTALGALLCHVRGERKLPGRPYEPENINWGMFPPPPAGTRKRDVKLARAHRARDALETWAAGVGLELAPRLDVGSTQDDTLERRARR